MSTTYGPPTRQLPKDLSALGNLTVRIEENAASATDQDVNVATVGAVAPIAQTADDWTPRFKALNDETVKGLLRSIGDAGAAPVNSTGATILNISAETRNAAQSVNTKLDVVSTVQAKLERWGKNVEPAWTHGAEATDPADGAALVTKAVSAAKTGFIYGFYITSPEARDFKINWTSGTAKSIRIVYASKGTTMFTDKTPVNEGLGAGASTNMTITNVGVGAGIFQAGLLTVEV